MNSINPPSLVSLKAPVVWNEDVYALGRDHSGDGKLIKYSISDNVWSVFSVPTSIYESKSELTTYCSKLLLISGESMTVWEFSSNNFAFQESCIKPIPRKHIPGNFNLNFIATSKDEYLIIVWYIKIYSRPTSCLFYDGGDWNSGRYRYMLIEHSLHSGYGYEVAFDSHAMVVIAFDLVFGKEVRILRAPILGSGEDEGNNYSCKELEVISSAEFNTLIYGAKYSTVLHNQQLYFVDSQGRIFMSFFPPPILPLVWGNSGVHFQQAPHLVGLPNGTMLMIGMVEYQHGSRLDVIKISQKGNNYQCKAL